MGLELGALITGFMVWMLSGLASPLNATLKAFVLGVCAFLTIGRDSGVLRFRLPEARRLVPISVLESPLHVAGLRFGLQLGAGFLTYIPTALPYLLAASLLLAGGLEETVLAATGFALGRFIIPVLRFWSVDPPAWDRRSSLSTPQALQYVSPIGVALIVAAFFFGTHG